MKEKNKGGRPHKKDLQLRKKVVSTRVTELEFLTLKREAKECHLSMSDFIYQFIKQGEVIKIDSQDNSDIIRKLTGQSNNLNQLTKIAHTNSILSRIPQFIELKNDIQESIKQILDDRKNYTR